MKVSDQPHASATLTPSKELPVHIHKEPDWSLVIVVVIVAIIIIIIIIIIILTEATENSRYDHQPESPPSNNVLHQQTQPGMTASRPYSPPFLTSSLRTMHSKHGKIFPVLVSFS